MLLLIVFALLAGSQGMDAEGEVIGDDSILARTSDGQEVKVDASVIFAVDPNDVVQVHIDKPAPSGPMTV